jgi:hypothetical protein
MTPEFQNISAGPELRGRRNHSGDLPRETHVHAQQEQQVLKTKRSRRQVASERKQKRFDGGSPRKQKA